MCQIKIFNRYDWDKIISKKVYFHRRIQSRVSLYKLSLTASIDSRINELISTLQSSFSKHQKSLQRLEQNIESIDELRQNITRTVVCDHISKLLDSLELSDNDVVNIFKLQDAISKEQQQNSKQQEKQPQSYASCSKIKSDIHKYKQCKHELHIQDICTFQRKQKLQLEDQLRSVDQKIENLLLQHDRQCIGILDSQSSDSFTLNNSFNVDQRQNTDFY